MTDQIMASFALGCTDTRRVITWDDILASQNMPNETKAAQKPWSIPVSYKHHGADHTKPIQADGRPFAALRRRNAATVAITNCCLTRLELPGIGGRPYETMWETTDLNPWMGTWAML